MRIPFIPKLQRTTRWLQRRFTSRSVILMYHRVAEKEIDPWSLCVTPQHFAEHLEVLKQFAQPIGLNKMVEALLACKIPDRSTVVTFDDGYANNLYNAKPLLELYNVPATVFVTPGYLEKGREYWWDELERIFLKTGSLPEKLSLCIQADASEWLLGAAVDYSNEDYRMDFYRRPWEGTPGSRLFVYYSIWQQLQNLPEAERQEAVDEIITWADASTIARSTHRPLTRKEVCALVQGGLVDVGTHTMNHLFLPAFSVATQRDEINTSKVCLEEVVGRPVQAFAYPFGAYNKETVALAQEAGFLCACSTLEEPVWDRSERFQLPRFRVQDWSGE